MAATKRGGAITASKATPLESEQQLINEAEQIAAMMEAEDDEPIVPPNLAYPPPPPPAPRPRPTQSTPVSVIMQRQRENYERNGKQDWANFDPVLRVRVVADADRGGVQVRPIALTREEGVDKGIDFYFPEKGTWVRNGHKLEEDENMRVKDAEG